jgi:flagellar export protein FliJ
MKFKFSLQSVLKVREHQEKLQKQKLAEEVSKKKKIDDHRMNILKGLEGYLQDRNDSEPAKILSVQRHGRHLEEIHKTVEKLNQDIKEVEHEVKKEREKLAEAHKKLHVIKKVEEYEYELFTKEMSKYEQKEMDETATQIYNR